MKRFLKTPAGLAIFAFWALGLSARAQLNTNTRFAELNQHDIRDVAVANPYTPYGDKTELNRYGDDGSAAFVESSGVVIWRTSDGVYRPLTKTTYAKPLFVTNAECVLWTNAFDSNVTIDPESGAVTQNIQLSYFRIDSTSGQLRETNVQVEGNKVLDTAVITTSTTPFMLVTANVAGRPAATNANHPLQNLFVYRLTYNSQTPQLLSNNFWSTNEYLTHGAETVSVSYDGSQVLRLSDDSIDSGVTGVETLFVWVGKNGVVKPCFRAADPYVVAAIAAGYAFSNGVFGGGYFTGSTYPIIRPVLTSSDRFVIGANRYDLNVAATPAFLYNYSRDPVADEVQVQDNIALPFPLTVPVSTGEVIPLPNYSQQGVAPVFVTQDDLGNLSVFKLNGNIATHLYKAKIPFPLGMDVAITRINANPGYESIALRDPTNQGVIWLHNGPGRNLLTGAPTTNFTLINEIWGRALFVTPGEVIVWTNALAAVLPSGSLQPVVIKHYGRDAVTGVITSNEVKVFADATVQNFISPGAVRGNQVFAPFPFTQAVDLWRLETGEKTVGNNALRLRRYQLLTPENADEDGDGIRGGMENGPFYVIPGTFTYSDAVADAARRGGHLATIGNAVEFDQMKAAIKLWQINSPLALPKVVVPYPLWIGLEGVGAAPPYAWQWSDATPPAFIAGNWLPGDPVAVVGRNRGRLTSLQQWEASNGANPGGYLLELTPTDPLAKDTDADGASDYDELFSLITDPVVPNFFSPPPPPLVPVPFSSSVVYGKYEGFMTQMGQGPIAAFTLSVTSKGGFTGRINGGPGLSNIRGTFNSATGAVTSIPAWFAANNLSATISMWIAPDPVTGIYRVSGRMTGLNGDPLIFELRRAAYSKTFQSPDAGSYTIAIPAADFPKEGQPNGDGYLTGTIGTDGRARLRGRTSDNVEMSWSGNEVEGNFLSFFSIINTNKGFVGSNLFVRDSAEVSTLNELAGNWHLVGQADIDGNLLVVRKPITSGSYQIAGYEYHSGAYGSAYLPVSYSQLDAFDQFTVAPNNVIIKFIDGIFSGQDVIATWATNNKITIPKTQTRTLGASINGGTGELRGTYRFNDPDYTYAQSVGALGGVVLQKSGEVRGYYKGGTTFGQVLLLPNVDGSQAPVTLISPRDRSNISYLGVTYKIYITASEPWTVTDIPTWVNVTPTTGTGNGVLVVTVAKNSSNLRRFADLTIAGLKHHIAQSYNPNGNASNVVVTPAVKSVNHLGTDGSVFSIPPYTVTVTGLVNGSAADFSSPVDWVVVTPNATFTGATIMVMPWMEWTGNYSPRTAEITIGGGTHTVIQTSREYDYWNYWWSY